MKKLFVLCMALLAAMAFAAPSTYTVLMLESGASITVDGDLSDWGPVFFVDSVQSDNNIFCRDNTFDWTATDFQYEVSIAHDASKVYFALKTTQDEGSDLGTNTGCSDSYKINPGGQAAAFYVFFNGSTNFNPSCPYAEGSTAIIGINTSGNGTNLPTVEFSLDKTIIDPFGMGMFQICPGFEEGDTPDCMDTHYGGIGVEYTGNKQDWSSNPWDNPLYYPTFTLSSTPAVETPVSVKNVETLAASPNPFKPATTLSYMVKNNGSLKIYDMAGKVVKSFTVTKGSGSVDWTADGLASGIYVARLISGKNVLNARLFLTR
jgi:hypothetical protein